MHTYSTGIKAVDDQRAIIKRKLIALRPNTQRYADELIQFSKRMEQIIS